MLLAGHTEALSGRLHILLAEFGHEHLEVDVLLGRLRKKLESQASHLGFAASEAGAFTLVAAVRLLGGHPDCLATYVSLWYVLQLNGGGKYRVVW